MHRGSVLDPVGSLQRPRPPTYRPRLVICTPLEKSCGARAVTRSVSYTQQYRPITRLCFSRRRASRTVVLIIINRSLSDRPTFTGAAGRYFTVRLGLHLFWSLLLTSQSAVESRVFHRRRLFLLYTILHTHTHTHRCTRVYMSSSCSR